MRQPETWRRFFSHLARTVSTRRAWLGAAFLLLALGSPQHYRNALHTANESARIYAAEALVDYHDPSLNPVFDHYFPGWRARRRPPNVDVSLREDRYLLDKAPGITLGAVPVVALLRLLGVRLSYRQLSWLLALLLAALPTVLALLWLRRWLIRQMDPVAAALPLALALASPWTVYAGLLFGHALAAALVAVGVALSLGPLQRNLPEAPPDAPPPRSRLERWWAAHAWLAPALGGLLLGAAVLTEYPAAWVVLVVLASLLIDPGRRRRLGPVVLGGLGPTLALALWNLALFGHPLHFSYAYKWNPQLAAVHGHGLFGIGLPSWDGLWGLLLSSQRGLLHWAPWLGFGVAGALWAGLDRRLSRGWRLALAIVPLGALLLIAGFPDWHGGRAVGPRYLLFVLPLWALGAAWLTHRLRAHPARSYGLAAGAGLMASSALLSWITATGYPYVSHRVTNPLFEVVLPVLEHDGFAPTIWDGLLPRPAGALLALACAVAATALLWPRRSARTDHARNAPSTDDDPTTDPALDPALEPGDSRSDQAHASPHVTAWRLGLVALTAAVLHLALASAPTTPGDRGRRLVARERTLAREVLNLEKGPRVAKKP